MLENALPTRNAPMTARQRRTILIASSGGALETFDFIIYGFFAQDCPLSYSLSATFRDP
jgi:hypothetical protein